MKPEKYLTELLYAHDCVIIPGFGGFVTNNAPARVNNLDHSFTPPSRILTFNRNLKNNDGLLANCIATVERSGFNEAMEQIRFLVADLERQLQDGKRVLMEGVGTFFMDKGLNLLFEPDPTSNFLPGSFGLLKFKSPPIKREQLAKKIEKKIVERVDRVKPIVTDTGTGVKKLRIGRVIALAATFTLIAGFVWIGWQTNLMEQNGMAEFNPFKSLKDVNYSPRAAEYKPITSEDLFEKASFDLNSTEGYTTFSLADNTIPVVVDLGNSRLNPDNTKVDNLNSQSKASNFSGRYHLIAGAFAVPSNADNYVISLRAQGLSAGIMEYPGEALRYVEVGAFDSKEDAVAALAKVRGAKPEVWLLVK